MNQATIHAPEGTFCGLSENLLSLAKTGNYRWHKTHLTYCIYDRVTGIDQQSFIETIGRGFQAWESVCGLTFERVEDHRKADFLVLARRIDGPGGILAEHELPPGDDRTIRGWLDLKEQWTTAMLLAVWTHELGHGLGLSHTNVANSLMNPFYNPSISTPQKWDIESVRNLYGKAKPKEVPADFPVPSNPTGEPAPMAAMFEVTEPLPAGMYRATFERIA